MAVQKNFVVKNGIEVNTNLIFGDTGSNKVGIATTNPQHTLHVRGGIGATSLNVTGISTVNNLTINGRVTAGSSLGAQGQYLVSTGVGVSWVTIPKIRVVDRQTAAANQTTFSTVYTVGLLDVYINGVRLSEDEYTAVNAATVTLDDACFGGETVEFISYSPSAVSAGQTGISGITILEEGTPVGTALQVTSINFVGAAVTAVGSGIGVTVYLSDYVGGSGISSYSSSAGIATYASTTGISTYSTNSGIATYASNAGIATYAIASGISTVSQGLTGTPNIEVGIITATNVVIGGGTTQLVVDGDARITGILTVGSSSITLDGATNTINVGSGVTIDGTAGTISATTFVGDGSGLVNVVGSGSGIVILDDGSTVGTAGTIDFGANLSVSPISSGIVTVTASGGAATQWETTDVGINTLSSVGIGTTNPTSALTVKGNTSLETLNVSGISTLGTSDISGDLTFTGNNDIYLKDGGVINFGDGNDLQIFHNGSVSVIRDGGTGGLLIDSDSEVKIAKNGTGNDNLAVFTPDGSVELYYDNSKKFETLGVGVTVTGTTFTNQLSVSGVSTFSGNTKFGNNNKILLGNNSDFEIYFDGSNTILQNSNTNSAGDLYVRSDSTLIQNFTGTETLAQFNSNGAVSLYYDNSKKFETTNTGATVTGDIRVGVDTSSGVILTSPNGTQYRLIVADNGTLSTVAV